MTEVHPNVHVCGEKEARELLLLHHHPRNDDSTKKEPPLFSRVVAIGFPSAPLTEEEMTLLVRRSRFRFSRKSSLRFRAGFRFYRALLFFFFFLPKRSPLLPPPLHLLSRADERENRRPSRFSRRLGRRRFALGAPRDDAFFSFFDDDFERCRWGKNFSLLQRGRVEIGGGRVGARRVDADERERNEGQEGWWRWWWC